MVSDFPPMRRRLVVRISRPHTSTSDLPCYRLGGAPKQRRCFAAVQRGIRPGTGTASTLVMRGNWQTRHGSRECARGLGRGFADERVATAVDEVLGV